MQTKNIEIERRWLVKAIDPAIFRPSARWGNARPLSIRQGYIDKNLRVRLTAEDGSGKYGDPDREHATLTVKTGKGLVREETDTAFSATAARMLLSSTKYVIEKTRYVRNGWELDVFKGKLAGLMMVERECRTAEEANALVLPEWVLNAVEVTATVTNRQLAKTAYFLDGEDDSPIRELIHRGPPRIVLTGAPCSGKSAAIAALREDPTLHCVPETATIVMGQVKVLPTVGTKAFQSTIRKVQMSFEDAAIRQASKDAKRAVLLDRGTLDAAAFMGGRPAYEQMFMTDDGEEYLRYDAVIMLALPSEEVFARECANNPVRRETYTQAKAIEQSLAEVWAKHPNFMYVTDRDSWPAKLDSVRAAVEETLKRVRGGA